MKSYPLVDLEKTDTPVFWVYNNLAYMCREYEHSLKHTTHYIYGDSHRKPSLNTEFKIIYFPNSVLKYFEDETLTWVLEFYYSEIERKAYFEYNDFSPFSIECFSVQYDLKEIEVQYELEEEEFQPDLGNVRFHFEQYVTNMYIYDYEKHGLYPNSQQLDFLVKEYLKEIEPDLSLKEELESRENGYHFTRDNIYSFFLFHFNSYKGDVHDFIKHCLEITNEVWSVKSPKNIKRQKYFDNWVSETLNQYPKIDPKKFYDNHATLNDENLDYTQSITIEELNEIDYTEDLLFNISGLELFLNDKRDTFTGSVYDFVKNVIDISKQNWKESFSDLKRKNIVKNWVEKTITELNLDKIRLGIEPTPEPPQPVESLNFESERVVGVAKDKEKVNYLIDDSLIIIPLIELVETDVPIFWAYYNYAELYKRHSTLYMEDGKRYYRHSKDEISDSIDSLGIRYLNTLKLNIVESFPYDFDNDVELINTGSGHLIGCFSAQYKTGKIQIGDMNYYIDNVSERLEKIQIVDFAKQNLHPNPQHLDLVVKYYLENIDVGKREPFAIREKVYSFFDYHCKHYEGSVYDFLTHSISIVDSIWEVANIKNIERKKQFVSWLKHTVLKYHLNPVGLGLEPNATPEPPQPVESVGIEHKKLTLTGKKVTIYHIFKQLIDRKFIGENAKEVAQFLIQNVNGFENDDINTLSTEISRNRETNLEKGTVGISKENRINLD